MESWQLSAACAISALATVAADLSTSSDSSECRITDVEPFVAALLLEYGAIECDFGCGRQPSSDVVRGVVEDDPINRKARAGISTAEFERLISSSAAPRFHLQSPDTPEASVCSSFPPQSRSAHGGARHGDGVHAQSKAFRDLQLPFEIPVTSSTKATPTPSDSLDNDEEDPATSTETPASRNCNPDVNARVGADALNSRLRSHEEPAGSTSNCRSSMRATIVVIAGYAINLVEYTDSFSIDSTTASAGAESQSQRRWQLASPFPKFGVVAVTPLSKALQGQTTSDLQLISASFDLGTSPTLVSDPASALKKGARTRLDMCTLVEAHIRCGSSSTTWKRHFPSCEVQSAASLNLCAHTGAGATVTVSRRYLISAVNEGHTLCVVMPPPMTRPVYQRLSAGAPSTAAEAPSRFTSAGRSEPNVSVTAMFLDSPLGGIADVICPSHDCTLTRCRGSGDGRVVHLNINTGTSTTADAASASSSGSILHHPSRPIVLLIEPGNLAADWSGLWIASEAPHSAASTASKVAGGSKAAVEPPAGLQSLLHWVDGARQTVRDRSNALTASRQLQAPTSASHQQHHPHPSVQSQPSSASGAVLSSKSLPSHIAVVMDGNGRWAQSRGLGRSAGHRAGVDAIHALIRACRRLRIPYLTLYAFSAQNWTRPADEVRTLMSLLAEFVATDMEELCNNGVRLLVNGDIARLPAPARSGLQRMIASSARNTGLTLCLALSYGGREEIVGGVVAACKASQAGLLNPSSLTPESFRSFLPHPDVPDPDLMIRTSGELRVSNFLLWQIAYSELYVTQTLWPDFDENELTKALLAYASRERRFGKTSAQVQAEAAGDDASAAAMLAAAKPMLGPLASLTAAFGGKSSQQQQSGEKSSSAQHQQLQQQSESRFWLSFGGTCSIGLPSLVILLGILPVLCLLLLAAHAGFTDVSWLSMRNGWLPFDPSMQPASSAGAAGSCASPTVDVQAARLRLGLATCPVELDNAHDESTATAVNLGQVTESALASIASDGLESDSGHFLGLTDAATTVSAGSSTLHFHAISSGSGGHAAASEQLGQMLHGASSSAAAAASVAANRQSETLTPWPMPGPPPPPHARAQAGPPPRSS